METRHGFKNTANAEEEYTCEELVQIRNHTRKYAYPDDLLGWRSVVITAACLFLSMAAYPACTHLLWGSPIFWPVVTLCVIGNSLSLVRTFELFHHCTHDSMFSRKAWNYWVGKISGAFLLANFDAWRRGHLQHHAVVGKPEATADDPNTCIFWTTEEWAKFPWYKKAVLRVARDPFIYFTLMPFINVTFFGIHRGNIPDLLRPNWVPPTKENDRALLHSLLPLAEFVLGYTTFGPGFVLYLLAGASLASTWGFFVWQLEHYVTGEVYYAMPRGIYHREMAALLGSTIMGLPRWLNHFWLGIGYHGVHHLTAQVPGYKLSACYLDLEPRMWRNIPYVGLRRALLSLLLVQYNPLTGRHESFPEYQWIVDRLDEEPLVMSLPDDAPTPVDGAAQAQEMEAVKEAVKEAVNEGVKDAAHKAVETPIKETTPNDAKAKYIRYSRQRREYMKEE